MSKAIANLRVAIEQAMKIRPKVGGFPYLAEVLWNAGVVRNFWSLPSCQSVYLTKEGPIVVPGSCLVTEMADVPNFDRDALIRALRADQAGKTTFPEFLQASWDAGIISYDVDFAKRTVAYYGCHGEVYVEEYPAVKLSN